jgi:REP element-mobilizing transposase RayT
MYASIGRKVFTGKMLERLHEILEDLLGKWDCKIVEFNGEADRVHILFHPARLRFATPQQAVRTRWLARWRAPIGLRLPPRPHIRRAESIRRWEP